MTQLATINRTDNTDIEFAGTNGNGRHAMVEVASSRAAQEVQAAMVVAKKFPRDETTAYNRVMQSCKRRTLAEQALYAYPKGGQTVTGPSIRLAEMLAQNWGNVDFGIIELEQREGESTVMSYAWDLETNTRQTKIFTVKHERFTRKGSYALNDPREIYELTANQGARRLRACILGVIPGDVVDAAVMECEKTMAGNNAEPLIDRIRKMVSAFAELGVTQEMIERRLAHKVEATAEPELVGLKKVYRSLKDGMASVADFFEAAKSETTDLDERLDAAKRARQQPTVSAAEGERIIQEKAAQARAAEAARQQSTSPAIPPASPATEPHTAAQAPVLPPPTQESASAGGEQGKGFSFPPTLPDIARVDDGWIKDAVLNFKPKDLSRRAAWDKFIAAFKPQSWKALDFERQDELYEQLREGTFRWT